MSLRKIPHFIRCTRVIAFLSIAGVTPAYAVSKVSSPDVTKGRIELEYRGGYDWDGDPSKDQIDQHKFVANYGITDRWRTEFKADLTGTSGERDWTFIEWANRFQINKDGSVWPKFSIQENYKFSLQSGIPDRLESTLLLSKDIGKFAHVTNINFESAVGSGAAAGTDVNLGWKTKYKYEPTLEPGGEFYADFGKVIGPAAAGAKKYSAGPVLYGTLAQDVKYEFGFLFGLSEAAPDGRLKAILTYGF